MAVEGVPNLHQVSPQLFRSGQPSRIGFMNMQRRGLRAVVNLHDDEPDDVLAKGSGLHLVHVPMNSFRVFSDDARLLVAGLKAIAAAQAHGPTLVHCVHGSDRTGGVIAAWRMVVQGWSKDAAIREMREGGFRYHDVLFSNARHLRKLDVDAIRKRLT
jgi:protein tyrosine/serine phosphatase